MIERCVDDESNQYLQHRWGPRVMSGVMNQNRQVGREWPDVKCVRCGQTPTFSWVFFRGGKDDECS